MTPITIPRMVSADRKEFCRNVSIASTNCSDHSTAGPRAMSFRSGSTRLCGRILLTEDI